MLGGTNSTSPTSFLPKKGFLVTELKRGKKETGVIGRKGGVCIFRTVLKSMFPYFLT
jgi:hypothetical protein